MYSLCCYSWEISLGNILKVKACRISLLLIKFLPFQSLSVSTIDKNLPNLASLNGVLETIDPKLKRWERRRQQYIEHEAFSHHRYK